MTEIKNVFRPEFLNRVDEIITFNHLTEENFLGIADIMLQELQESLAARGLTFTWYDPAYGGEKFSPAIMGNGTTHKYLLYCSDSFPFIHQNLVTINLGKSFSVNRGIDVFSTMTDKQGGFHRTMVTYPSGVVEETADDLHTLTYVENSLNASNLNQKYYVDDYTSVTTARNGLSKMGYSFVITFRTEEGETLELFAYEEEFGSLKEGASGTLTYQGRYFVDFR